MKPLYLTYYDFLSFFILSLSETDADWIGSLNPILKHQHILLLWLWCRLWYRSCSRGGNTTSLWIRRCPHLMDCDVGHRILIWLKFEIIISQMDDAFEFWIRILIDDFLYLLTHVHVCFVLCQISEEQVPVEVKCHHLHTTWIEDQMVYIFISWLWFNVHAPPPLPVQSSQ